MRRILCAGGWAVLAGAIVVSGTQTLLAASPRAAAKQESRKLTEEALGLEAEGEFEKAQGLLDQAIELDPRNESARWREGYVAHLKDWVKYDQIPELQADRRAFQAYLKRRAETADNAAAQFALAEWCGQQGLLDQQRAHLHAVLQHDPENAVAHTQLGDQKIGDQWVTPEQMRDQRRREEEFQRNRQAWLPKLKKLSEEMNHRSLERRQKAEAEFREIRDPNAIPALEEVFYGQDREKSLAVIDLIGVMDDPNASAWLAWQAVADEDEELRKASVQRLSSRPYEEYVPLLIGLMENPLQTRSTLAFTWDGRIIHRQEFFKEGKGGEKHKYAVADTGYKRIRVRKGDPFDSTRRALTQASAAATAANVTAAAESYQIEQKNERVHTALSATTGQTLEGTPESWQEWWAEYTEYEKPEPTGIDSRYGFSRRFVVDRYWHEGYATPYERWEDEQYAAEQQRRAFVDWYNSLSPAQRKAYDNRPLTLSCLAAGTPVWTESGLVPVEKLQIGDRVLSKDVDSGELAYKPILATTIRPPVDVKTVKLDGESFIATGGHMFWVSGSGWTRVRDLRAGHRLHSIEGLADVGGLEEAQPEEVYNLVVADFHTYFVGESKVLSHDNGLPEPTAKVVPGL